MRKVMVILLLAGFSLYVSPSFADEKMEKGMGKDMTDGGMMKHMMMKSMMEKSVVATADGGIVVVTGNKIAKYDKDLNLTKEAEIKVDAEAMKKDMEGMMKMCPMMKGETKDMGEDSDSTDHSAHH